MDLDVAASGGGYGHTECPQGIPVEFALLSILAAFGVAFGVLYMALTLQTMGRRKRSTGEAGEGEGEEQYGGDLAFKFGDLLWAGELLCFRPDPQPNIALPLILPFSCKRSRY